MAININLALKSIKGIHSKVFFTFPVEAHLNRRAQMGAYKACASGITHEHCTNQFFFKSRNEVNLKLRHAYDRSFTVFC